MFRRTLVFLAGASLFGAVYAGVAWWVTVRVEAQLSDSAVGELKREASLLARLVGDRPFTDSLADSLGRMTGLRVTLISPEGRVLGDSDASPGRLLYVTLPHGPGVIRLGVSRAEVEARGARIRNAFVLGGVLLVIGAGAASVALARLSARPLRRLREQVQTLATGGSAGRIRVRASGELGSLARAVDSLRERNEALAQDLAAGQEDLEGLFRTIEDGLAVVDGHGFVVRGNRAFEALAGIPAPEGRRLESLFRLPELSGALRRSAADGPVRLEVELGGRPLAVSVHPRRDGALVVFRDLTRLRRLEDVRRDFVANVSHELKTPLTSIMGFGEAMAEGALPPEQSREFARRVVANAGRMRALVDDLLDLSRIESGRWEPRPADLELVSLARSVWESFGSGALERGIHLTAASDPLPAVRGDPEAVRQVLRNLFDNALRYAPDGSEIRLSAEHEAGWVRIAVSDTGAGIPSAHISRIFERFYRVDPARSREAGGTGLGLSIVKHLVEAHGGRVGVDSELRAGTTVWFTLPAAS
ncbi:MAG: ATP-binding protein [Gemmatimonadota bacterium]